MDYNSFKKKKRWILRIMLHREIWKSDPRFLLNFLYYLNKAKDPPSPLSQSWAFI